MGQDCHKRTRAAVNRISAEEIQCTHHGPLQVDEGYRSRTTGQLQLLEKVAQKPR